MAGYFTGKESEAAASPAGGQVAGEGGKAAPMAQAQGTKVVRETPGPDPQPARANTAVNTGYKLVVPAGQVPATAPATTPATPTVPSTPTTPTTPSTPTTPVVTTPETPTTPTVPATLTLSKPVFIKPVADSTGIKIAVDMQLQITANTGTATHVSTDWEVRRYTLGVLGTAWTDYQDKTNKTSVTVPGLTLTLGTAYYLRARYRADNNLVGEWSDEVKITTALI